MEMWLNKEHKTERAKQEGETERKKKRGREVNRLEKGLMWRGSIKLSLIEKGVEGASFERSETFKIPL